jgi:hypothetical protein
LQQPAVYDSLAMPLFRQYRVTKCGKLQPDYARSPWRFDNDLQRYAVITSQTIHRKYDRSFGMMLRLMP